MAVAFNTILTALMLGVVGAVVAFFGWLYFDEWRRRARIRRSMRRAREQHQSEEGLD